MAEVIVRAEVEMTAELKKAFADLGAGLAAATAAIRKATPPTPLDMLPGGLRGAAAAPKGATLAEVQQGKRNALLAFLDVLDSWIEGARSNHDALDHRSEIFPCWRQFTPEDIRRMVNDAAREVGIDEFPYPKVPKEDTL
jgi:hypothetical protein